jgi:predicted LPLAT superfamily acyltransferase
VNSDHQTPTEDRVPRTPAQARQSHLESALWRRALVWGLRTVPLPLQRASMPLWSAFFYLQVPHVRRAIESNLARLLDLGPPRLQLSAYQTFTNYCQTVANTYLAYLGLDPDLSIALTGTDNLREVISGGGGAVLATAHLGNWQLGPHYLDRHGFPPVTVVMTEEPDGTTQDMVAELRDRYTPGSGATKDHARVAYPGRSPLLGLELRANLRRGELVAFQMDRPVGQGLRVPFAGGTATFAAGPALLARTCDVPVVPVFFPLSDSTLHIVVEHPLYSAHTSDRQQDVRRLTAELALVYERMVLRHPEQWFNFFDFWSER